MRRWRLLLLIVAVGVGAVLYAAGPIVLAGIGSFLVVGGTPGKADVIVVMRGDEEFYDRALTAARLFNRGYASAVYISAALADRGSQQLQARGITLPSGRDNIVSVLRQSGVPCDRIVVDRGSGGGGTAGEMRRVLQMTQARGISSILVVTSWFHARRVAMVMRQVLRPSLTDMLLVVADSSIGPHNWWQHRYMTITVFEEFVKLALQATVGSIGFSDDPREEPGPAATGSPPSCAGAADTVR